MSLIEQWIRRLRGRDPLAVVDGTRQERNLVESLIGPLERDTGKRFRREYRVRFRPMQRTQFSKTLGRPVGVVWEPPRPEWDGVWAVGLTEPSGRSCYVVRGPTDNAEPEIVRHELAEILSIQNGLRGNGKDHRPAAWGRFVWGWTQ